MKASRPLVIAAVAAATFSSAVVFSPPADATEIDEPKVGAISAYYRAAPRRDYEGAATASRSTQCVIVERKAGTTTWTDGYVNNAIGCGTGFYWWSITNDAAVSNTTAIRLRVYSGPNAPKSFVNICNTKSQCLAMT